MAGHRQGKRAASGRHSRLPRIDLPPQRRQLWSFGRGWIFWIWNRGHKRQTADSRLIAYRAMQNLPRSYRLGSGDGKEKKETCSRPSNCQSFQLQGFRLLSAFSPVGHGSDRIIDDRKRHLQYPVSTIYHLAYLGRLLGPTTATLSTIIQLPISIIKGIVYHDWPSGAAFAD